MKEINYLTRIMYDTIMIFITITISYYMLNLVESDLYRGIIITLVSLIVSISNIYRTHKDITKSSPNEESGK